MYGYICIYIYVNNICMYTYPNLGQRYNLLNYSSPGLNSVKSLAFLNGMSRVPLDRTSMDWLCWENLTRKPWSNYHQIKGCPVSIFPSSNSMITSSPKQKRKVEIVQNLRRSTVLTCFNHKFRHVAAHLT